MAVLPTQKEVPLTATHTQLQVVVEEETLVLLKQLQQELSHIYPDGNYNDIIKYAAKKLLTRISKQGNAQQTMVMETALEGLTQKTITKVESPNTYKATDPKYEKHRSGNFSYRSRYIAASVRKKVFQRANNQCEFVGINKHRCQSRFQLEVDHILSFSHGGENNESNLQLLCKNHNLYKMNLTHNNS